MEKRKLSADARKAISRRMNKYWAGLRNPDHTKRAEAVEAMERSTKPRRQVRKRRVMKRAARTHAEIHASSAIDPTTRRSMDYVRAAETAVLNSEIERLVGHVAQAIMLRGPMLQIQDYNLVTWCLRKMIENRAAGRGKSNGREVAAATDKLPPFDIAAFATAYPALDALDPRD